MSERRGRIHEKHELSKTRRCGLLDVARSSAYYRREPVSEADLAVMRLIDEIHLQLPFYGSRRMRDELEERGHTVNRKRVQRLMRQMGLRALYPRRRTSQPGKGHKIYPYLLRDLSIERANQAWATDISYIPMAKGFMYLVAIMDWYSRPGRAHAGGPERAWVRPQRDCRTGGERRRGAGRHRTRLKRPGRHAPDTIDSAVQTRAGHGSNGRADTRRTRVT